MRKNHAIHNEGIVDQVLSYHYLQTRAHEDQTCRLREGFKIYDFTNKNHTLI